LLFIIIIINCVLLRYFKTRQWHSLDLAVRCPYVIGLYYTRLG